MSVDDFGTLPHRLAQNAYIVPFRIAVSNSEIDRLHLLLDNCPLADANWENSQEDGRFGVTRDWLEKAVRYWRHSYDWLQWEAQFNSFPQYMIKIEDDDGRAYNVRFTALFSTNSKALPILFLHGWPGSAVEFLPMLELIKQQYATADSLPYHVIVPDLIGFGFSSRPPIDADYSYEDNARILVKMMHSLGFTAENGGYVTQGGDLGGALAPKMAVLDPENCRLTHVNMLVIPPPDGTDVERDIRSGMYTPDEVESLRKGMAFQATGSAYAAIQGTRPATCGLAISSSPVALLAWLGEKFLQWSDPHSQPSLEHIITTVSFYWFSRCYPTSIWAYRWMVAAGPNIRSGWFGIQCPLGYSWFKSDYLHPPKQWRESTGIVKWFRDHERGGHFAALEQPRLLWEDVVDMINEFGIQPSI